MILHFFCFWVDAVSHNVFNSGMWVSYNDVQMWKQKQMDVVNYSYVKYFT